MRLLARLVHADANMQNSPTGSASSNSERSNHIHPSAQTQSHPGTTFNADPDSHRPTNSRRQDSAISHLGRPDPAKEISSLVRPSEPDVASSHRSPNSSQHSTSPTTAGHVLSHLHSSAPAPPSTAREHVTSSLTLSHLQAAPELSNRTLSPLQPDPSHSSSARQAKYNVRFAPNHTPETMPSAQRPRQGTPPSVTAPASDTAEQAATPQAEPVHPPKDLRSQVLNSLLRVPEKNSHSDSNIHEDVERCSSCNEAWSPMPINAAALAGLKPVQTVWDIARDIEARQGITRQQERENAEAFEQWKKKHSQCPVVPNSPPQSSAPASNPNKRKSEGSHGDVTKKRVSFNGHGTTAPPVQSTTPT